MKSGLRDLGTADIEHMLHEHLAENAMPPEVLAKFKKKNGGGKDDDEGDDKGGNGGSKAKGPAANLGKHLKKKGGSGEKVGEALERLRQNVANELKG